jgi:hypothetical protein
MSIATSANARSKSIRIEQPTGNEFPKFKNIFKENLEI